MTLGKQQRSYPIYITVFVGCGVLVALTLSSDPGYLSPDSVESISVARNIARGAGNATDIVYYDQQHHFVEIPVPQTVFPPGFAALISPFCDWLLPAFRLPVLIASISLTVASLMVVLILRQSGVAETRTLAMGIFCQLLAVNLYICIQGLSDTTFLALSLMATYFIVRSENASAPAISHFWLILASAFASAAFVVRYFGVFFILSLFLFIAFRTRHCIRQTATRLAIPSAICGTVIVGFALRNLTTAGVASGGPTVRSTDGLQDILVHGYWSLSDLLGFSFGRMFAGSILDIVFFILAALATLSFLLVYLRSLLKSEWSRAFATPAAQFLLFYVAIALAGLFTLELRNGAIDIRARYVLPVFISTILLFAIAAKNSADRFKVSRLYFYEFLVLAAIMIGQVSAVLQYHDGITTRRSIYDSVSVLLEQARSTNPPVFRHPHSRPIITNMPHTVYLISGRPTVGFAIRSYSNIDWNLINVAQSAIRFDIDQAVVVTRSRTHWSAQPGAQPYMEDLLDMPATFEVSEGEYCLRVFNLLPKSHSSLPQELLTP